MAFRIIGGGGGSGGGTVVQKVEYPVMGGVGLLVGNGEGAVARELLYSGPIRVTDAAGIGGNPVISSVDAPAVIAQGMIDATLGTAQQLAILPGMLECEIIEVSFRKFSTVGLLQDGADLPAAT